MRCFKLFFLASVFCLLISVSHAQTIPGEEPQPKKLKGLTERQVREYMAGGDGAALSRLADLYNYPLPAYVTAYAAELNLTDDQAKVILASRKRVQLTSKKIGTEIIAKERELEEGFEKGILTPEELSLLTTDIGVLQGRLRATYLYAALEMKSILKPEQLAKYQEIRTGAAPTSSSQ